MYLDIALVPCVQPVTAAATVAAIDILQHAHRHKCAITIEYGYTAFHRVSHLPSNVYDGVMIMLRLHLYRSPIEQE